MYYMISNSITGFTKGSRVAGPSRSWELVFSYLHYPIHFMPLVLVSPSLSGSYVGYTRRQVCYLAAKALTGAHLDGTLPQDTLFLPKFRGPDGPIHVALEHVSIAATR